MMTSRLLVSVLIPAYNAGKYIGQAINSILTQTYPSVEVVVVNDGSTDDTSYILRAFEDKGVRVINQANSGQCAAANRAFKESRGELVKFFDADDILDPDHLAIQVERLGDRRDAIALGEWARFYNDDPQSAVFNPLPMYRDADPIDWLTTEWMDARPMMQCALWLIPRPILERSGLWDERLSLVNDFEFFARVLLESREILFTPGARLRYRSGIDGSLSQQRSRESIVSAYNSLMWGTEHLLSAMNSERTRRAAANILQDFIYTYYPAHADLRDSAQARVKELGVATIDPDGSPAFQMLRRMTGWKFARRVERLVRESGNHPIALLRRVGWPMREPS